MCCYLFFVLVIVIKLELKKMCLIYLSVNSVVVSGDVVVFLLLLKLCIFLLLRIVLFGINFNVLGLGVFFVWMNIGVFEIGYFLIYLGIFGFGVKNVVSYGNLFLSKFV